METKILFIWHAAADPTNRALLTEVISHPGIKLTVITTKVVEDRLKEWSLNHTLSIRNRQSGSLLQVIPAMAVFPRSLGYHFYPGLPRLISTIKPDIIHIHEEAASLSAVEAAFWRRAISPKSLLVIHPYQNVRVDYRRPWPALERFVLRSVDAAVAGNPGAAKVLSGRGFHRPVYTLRTLGANEKDFGTTRLGPSREPSGPVMPIIGFSGRIFSGKGLHILLEAAARMKVRAGLLVVGDGPRLAEARAQAIRLGIAGSIRWVGAVPTRRMGEYYSSMDIYAAPTIDRPGDMPDWKEQCPRAHIEAMLSGLPIVASDGGENRWTLGRAGIIVPQGDSAALARALDRLCSSAALRRAIGQRARARAVECFTWEKAASGLIAIWKKLLKGRAHGQS